ncbi:hypothetical protein ACFOY6_23795, partial [Pseudoroseomonas aestuarii]
MFRKFLLLAPLLLPPMLLAAGPAAAQMESREGIALQNQILQLRQELDMMRRSGGGGGYAAPVPMAPPAGRGGVAGGSPELLSQMLERVGALEEEVRRLRGQVQESEYRVRTTLFLQTLRRQPRRQRLVQVGGAQAEAGHLEGEQ